ncbi:hypothetical protein ACF0H5_021440 [Mactra antiquata]
MCEGTYGWQYSIETGNTCIQVAVPMCEGTYGWQYSVETGNTCMQAFKKTQAETNIPVIELELVTEKYYDRVCEFEWNNYVAIATSLGVENTDEFKNIWMSSFKLNLSLIFIDKETKDIIAMRAIRIACKDDVLDLESIKSQSIRDMLAFDDYCDKYADFFGHYGVSEAFHF